MGIGGRWLTKPTRERLGFRFQTPRQAKLETAHPARRPPTTPRQMERLRPAAQLLVPVIPVGGMLR
jgi:hypothetical protein